MYDITIGRSTTIVSDDLGALPQICLAALSNKAHVPNWALAKSISPWKRELPAKYLLCLQNNVTQTLTHRSNMDDTHVCRQSVPFVTNPPWELQPTVEHVCYDLHARGRVISCVRARRAFMRERTIAAVQRVRGRHLGSALCVCWDQRAWLVV